MLYHIVQLFVREIVQRHIRPELDQTYAKFLGFFQQLQRGEGTFWWGVRKADGPWECVRA
jgi:hypothetical protein